MNSRSRDDRPQRSDQPHLELKQAIGSSRGFFARFSALVLTVFLLATPLLVHWAGLAVATNSNRLSDWLPSNLEETVALKKFNAWFGGDGQFVVVSWDGCRIDTTADPADTSKDDPRLERLARLLVPSDVITSGNSNAAKSNVANSNTISESESEIAPGEMLLVAPSNFNVSNGWRARLGADFASDVGCCVSSVAWDRTTRDIGGHSQPCSQYET